MINLFIALLYTTNYLSSLRNTLFYEGYNFAVLDDIRIESQKGAEIRGYCQKEELSIPDGWVIAPSSQFTTNFISKHPFATDSITLADGNSYYTSLGSKPGQLYKENSLILFGDSKYLVNPNTCNSRILLIQKRNVFSCKALGKRYEISTVIANHSSASQTANKLKLNLKSGSLLEVNSQEEIDCITKKINDKVWTGGHYNNAKSIYTWADGEPVNTSKTQADGGFKIPFEDGHPIYSSGFSLALKPNGKFESIHESKTLNYVIEYETISHCSTGYSFEIVDSLDRAFVTFDKALEYSEQNELYGHKGELASIINEEEQKCVDTLCGELKKVYPEFLDNKGVWMGARISSVVSASWIYTEDKYRTKKGVTRPLNGIYDVAGSYENRDNVFYDVMSQYPVKNDFYAHFADGQPDIGKGTNYYIKACGKDNYWFADKADSYSFYLVKYGSALPEAPSISIKDVGDKEITLDIIVLSDGGSDITTIEVTVFEKTTEIDRHYKINITIDKLESYGASYSNSIVKNLKIKNLTNLTEYSFETRIRNKTGWSEESGKYGPSTPKGTPEKPFLYMTKPEDHSVIISFKLNKNDGGYPVSSCKANLTPINHSLKSKPATKAVNITQGDDKVYEIHIEDLDNFIKYEMNLLCTNPKGDGSVVSANVTPLSPKTVDDFKFLKALNDRTLGGNWTVKWRNDGDYCTEFGITCEQGRVVRINLMNNNLVGKLPMTLGNLDRLKELLLSNNKLTGTLPKGIKYCKELVSLYLSNNKLRRDFVKEIFKLKKIKYIYLDGNLLTNELHSELFKDTDKLKHIRLNKNALTGFLSTEIFKLNEIEILDLSHNLFSGPLALGTEENNVLRTLDLSGNRFLDEFPETIKHYKGILSMNLSDNILEGKFPETITELTQLESLRINGNRFIGNISDMNVLFKKLNLKELYMNDNWWSCPLEEWKGVAVETDSKINDGMKCWCKLTEWSEPSKCYYFSGEGSVLIQALKRSVIEKEKNGGYCFELKKIQNCSSDK